MTDVLVIAAHPDDEVLGCGGTIARWARAGRSVRIAILGEGITARGDADAHADDAMTRLHADARAVGEMLGAEGVTLCGLPDNRFDTLALLDVVRQVEALVAQYTPETIYTHHGGDLNIDHAVTHRAVLTATRPMAGGCVRKVFAFEVASSTEWAFGQCGLGFTAQHVCGYRGDAGVEVCGDGALCE
jgi:LmbE family N-acetylglucosaminyl deacetylase